MNLTDKIYELLENIGYKVYFGWYQKDVNETHVTFFIYNASPTAYSDSEYELIENSLQLDVWGTNEEEVQDVESKCLEILRENVFYWSESNREYETDTGIYHYANRYKLNV